MRKSFKKGLAMVLAAAMVFSTPVVVDKTVSAAAEEESKIQTETLTGTAWWTGNQAGKDYAINKGNKTVLFVMAQTGGDFSVEVKGTTDGTNYFLTTGSDQNGWLAEGAVDHGTVSGANFVQGASDNSIVVAGHLYKITVDRTKESEMTVEYYDVTTDTSRCTIKWADGNMPDEAGVHVIAQVGTYQVITGIETLGDAVAVSVTGGAVSLKDGKLEFAFGVKDASKGIPISVNGNVVVATGSALTVGEEADEDGYVNATYTYTPSKDGKYTFAVSSAVTEDGVLYTLDGEAAAEITLVTVGDTMYVEDKALITGDLGVAKGKTDNEFAISWTAAEGTQASAVVTGPDGKQVGNALTAPGSVTVTAAGNYDVVLTVTKDGKVATQTSGFSYRPAGAGTATDKFSKITSAKPVFKSTFDTADSAKNDGVDMTGSKATIKDGVLVLASDTSQHGQYYAKMPSLTTEDFTNGITFIADVNPSKEGDWTPYAVFGDGKLAQKDAAGTTYRWAITEGFSSIAGPSTNYHETGYYGSGAAPGDASGTFSCPISAPYTFDYFKTAANCNKWYTIAVTVKKNEMITYVNGVQIQKGTKDYSTIINGMKKASNNYLGASYWDADADFAGSMDDVAVYNTALSAADIKTLTRSDATVQPPVDPPVSTAKVSKVAIKVPNKKSGKTIYMKVKDKLTLKATVTTTGKGSISKAVTWKSSKKAVASVTSKGKVTAKKAGTAKITATSKADKSKKATITIKVSKKAVKNKALKLKATKKTVKKGKTYTIAIKKITTKTTEKITYKTSKKSVATVDAYGVVKAKKKGKANITVKCGKKKATLKVTVK